MSAAVTAMPLSTGFSTKKSCDISPTYISSDLLSPSQRGRITTPFIGKQTVDTPALGGKTWGENVTNYGGIGKLPFLGKTRARDLYVSRSHRHYSSGFSRYLSSVQPYSRTSLKLSECRVNDEVLPPTFKVTFDPRKYSREGDLPIHAYFSHTSKFEVFPSQNPDRHQTHGVQLSQRTVEALKDYYTKLYDIPQNVTIYPNLVPAILERITNANKHPDNDEEDPANITSELDPATSRGYLLGDLLTTIFQKDEDFENPYLVRGVLLTMLDRQDIFGLTHLLSILKTLAEDNTDDDHMDVLYQTQSYRFICTLLEVLEKPGDHEDVKLQRVKQIFYDVGLPELASTGPLHVTGILKKMKEVEPLPSIAGASKNVRFKPTEPANESDDDPTTRCRSGLPQYKRLLDHIIPERLSHAPVNDTDEQQEVYPILRQFYTKAPDCSLKSLNMTEDVNGNGGRTRTLPPYPPLCSRLHPTGNLMNDRIGLKFKAEAHRRYHEMYPDSVPDLRDSHITRKKYFFYGYHASAFRG